MCVGVGGAAWEGQPRGGRASPPAHWVELREMIGCVVLDVGFTADRRISLAKSSF